MPPGEWIAIGGLLLTIIVTAVSLTFYVASLKSDMQGLKGDLSEKINVTKELFYKVVEGQADKEAKARHDMNAHFATMISAVELDLSQMNRRFDQVVHKEDLHAMEARVVTAIDKLERRMERGMGLKDGG